MGFDTHNTEDLCHPQGKQAGNLWAAYTKQAHICTLDCLRDLSVHLQVEHPPLGCGASNTAHGVSLIACSVLGCANFEGVCAAQVVSRIERLEGTLDNLPKRLANLSPSYFVVTS